MWALEAHRDINCRIVQSVYQLQMSQHNRPPTLNIPRPDLSQSQISPSPRRRKDLFITSQQSVKEPSPLQRVQDVYKQLNSVIDDMDGKIQDVINRHQAEFLLAYRNHMKKIKLELEEIRSKSANAESAANSFDRISVLEKQLVLFREESLKLYDSLEEKNRECDQYKLKLDEASSHNRFLEAEVKKLMKRTKYLEAQFHTTSHRSSANSQHPPQIQPTSLLPPSRRTLTRKIRTADTNRLSVSSAGVPFDRLRQIVNDDTVLNNIRQVIVEAQGSRVKKMEQISSKYVRMLKQTNTQTTRSNDLEEFFWKCVDTVRKEIVKRNNTQATYKPDEIDFETFRKVDCLRVLELFVSDERVRKMVYNEVFGKVVPTTTTIYNKRMRGRSSRFEIQNQSHQANLTQIQFTTDRN